MQGSLTEAQQTAVARGGRLLSQAYLGTCHVYHWQCRDGHIWAAQYYDVKRGSWCPQCATTGVGERVCRAVFELAFAKPFPKTRPEWLRTTSGARLELDGYSAELQVAFEHHGRQHFDEKSRFNGSAAKLLALQARDSLKLALCEQSGVRLFVAREVPQKTSVEDLLIQFEQFCDAHGLSVLQRVRPEDVSVRLATADPLEPLQALAASYGGELLSKTYLGPDTKLLWRCAYGHTWERTPRKSVGRWCRRCKLRDGYLLPK